MGARQQARRQVVQLLYHREYQEVDPQASAACFWPKAAAEQQAFAQWLFRGALERMNDIDALIEKVSEHWKLHRMPVVDRNILRLAVFELLAQHDVPGKVIMDEAIEIAKVFGTEDSPAFVNGILDKIFHDAELRPVKKATTP